MYFQAVVRFLLLKEKKKEIAQKMKGLTNDVPV